MGFSRRYATTDDQDRQRGLEALQYFFNKSKELHRNFRWDWLAFVQLMDARKGDPIRGLGLGITVAEVRDDQIKDAMENLALRSNGGIPANSQFVQALSDSAQKLDLEFFKEVAEESIKDAVRPVLAVGATAIGLKIAMAVITAVVVAKMTGKK